MHRSETQSNDLRLTPFNTSRPNTSRPDTRRYKLRRFSLIACLAAATAITACGGDDSGGDSSRAWSEDAASAYYDDASASAAEFDEMSGDEMAARQEASAAPQPATEPANGTVGTPLGLPAGRDIIVTIDVTLETDNLRETMQTILNSATNAGGYLADSDIYYGDESGDESDAGHATLVVRVPTQSTQDFVDTLASAGTVTASNQSTSDVTSQRVDLEVRIANATDSVATVRALLERATDLRDVVALETELNQRVTDLELLKARQRGLSDQLAMSTVNVSVRTAGAPPIEPEEPTVGSAFQQGWDDFTNTASAIARGLAAALPFLVTGVMLLVALAWAGRRFASKSARPQNETSPGGTPPPAPTPPPSESADIERQAA